MTEEKYWFAGLFEADGSFGRGGNEKQRMYLCVQMTDKDTLDKCAHWIGGAVNGPYMKNAKRSFNAKPMWSWNLNKQSEVWALVDEIYPLLSDRRKAHIDEARIRRDSFVDGRIK